MSNGPCPECGNNVALSAHSCPKCGNRNFVLASYDFFEICSECGGSGGSHETNRDINGKVFLASTTCWSCHGSGTNGKFISIDGRESSYKIQQGRDAIENAKRQAPIVAKKIADSKAKKHASGPDLVKNEIKRHRKWKNWERRDSIYTFFGVSIMLGTIPLALIYGFHIIVVGVVLLILLIIISRADRMPGG